MFSLKKIYIMQIKNVEEKIPDITNLATNACLNAKIMEVIGEILNVTNLASATALTAVEHEISNVSNLVKKLDCNTKTNEIEKKVTSHDHGNKHILLQNLINSRKVCCRIKTNKFSKQK